MSKTRPHRRAVTAARYSVYADQRERLRRESRRLFRRGALAGSVQPLTEDRAASELLRRLIDYGLGHLQEVLGEHGR